MSWSVDTLGAQILGELNQDRNASGGTVPDRMENLVKEALRYIWCARDWSWQLRQANLTITAGDTEEDLPADFREMHSWELHDEDESESLILTNDVRRWLEYNQTFDSTDTGHPILGCIVRKTATPDSWVWQVRFAPKADENYVFPYIYLPQCPIDLAADHADNRTDSELLIMPEPMQEGWHLRALYKAHQRWGSPERAAIVGAEFNSWMQTAITENDETITDNPDPIKDGYGDWAAVLREGDPRAHDVSVLPNI